MNETLPTLTPERAGQIMEIKLNGSSGVVAIISPRAYRLVSGMKWYLSANGYVASSRGVSLHRLIAGARRGQHVDHINLNRLDNRDENLRIALQAENNRNVRKRAHSKQEFKGVRLRKSGTFCARIRFDGREIYLGTFSTALEAARAYDAAAISLHGQFGRTNFSGERR